MTLKTHVNLYLIIQYLDGEFDQERRENHGEKWVPMRSTPSF